MDHLNKILMQKDNLTTPRFCGSNIGNHYISLHQLNYYQYFKKYSQKTDAVGWFFSILELTINETNLDESDIRFPDILSNNTSDNDNEMPTFLELPKQHIHVPKGKYFIWSEKTYFF